MPNSARLVNHTISSIDTIPWEVTSPDSFALDQKLQEAGVSPFDQKRLFFIKASRNMSVDKCDNLDSTKVHPAFLLDKEQRDDVDRVTMKIILDLVSGLFLF